jgi:hypothetical protein
MAEIGGMSFTHVLVGDVVDAMERCSESDTQLNRRNLVRAAFSAIEGLLWQLKQDVARNARKFSTPMSVLERAAMDEQTYRVDNKGVVSAQPKFLPIATSIRLVVRIVSRYRSGYEVDFAHAGWGRLRRAVEVRHRIVHPKNKRDVTVSDNDVADCIGGFYWFLALVIEVLRESVDEIKSHIPPELLNKMTRSSVN